MDAIARNPASREGVNHWEPILDRLKVVRRGMVALHSEGTGLMLVRLSLFLVLFHIPAGIVSAALPAREPVAVVYLSSLDKALDDIDYLVHAGGRPELSQQLTDLVEGFNNLKGLDRTQPFGVFAFLPLDIAAGNANPELVGFVPITDPEALKKTLASTSAMTMSSAQKPNRYELAVSGRTFQALVDQGHVLFTDKADLLDQPLPSLATLTSPLSGQYDIVVQLRQLGVPKLMWDLALLGVFSASDQAIAGLKQSSTADDKLKIRAIEMSRRALATAMSEVRTVWLGLRISRESRNAVLDLKFEFTDSGSVAKTLNSMASGAVAFARDADAHAPAGLHLHLAFPDEAKQLMVDVARIAREEFDSSKSVPDPQRANASALLDVVQQTVGEGQYEVLVQFVGKTRGGMTLVIGVHVADGNKLSDAVTKILPSTVKKGAVADIQLNAGEARGVRFARIDQRMKDPNHERKVGLFYGSKPSLYVGMEPQTLWLIVGDSDALNDFSKVPSMPKRSTAAESSNSMIQAGIHLSDWMGLMSLTSGKRDREITAAARAALKDPERDELRLTVTPASDGLQFSLSLDEAYLNLISAAILKE